MSIWIALEPTRWAERMLSGGQLPQLAHRWFVCPGCCYAAPLYPSGATCPRSRWERNTYGGDGAPPVCDIHRPLVELPADIQATLWASLRLGGTNAAREVLFKLRPEDVGLPSALAQYKARRDGWA